MATITKPRHKICRTIGYCLYDDPKCPSKKRPYGPGHGAQNRRKKKSPYGEQLLEKQKLRLTYGLLEKQFYRTFVQAGKLHGNNSDNFLILLESRLMSLVYRIGLASSMFDARQLINHGHITIDGKCVDIPSYRVKAGQVIGVHEASKSLDRIKMAIEKRPSCPAYLELEGDGISAKFIGIQHVVDIPVTRINVQKIVEFYSK